MQKSLLKKYCKLNLSTYKKELYRSQIGLINIWKSINVIYHINQKDKNHLIGAEKDTEKEFDEV